MEQNEGTGKPLPKEIGTMGEFYEEYLPEYDARYPITIRVSEEERILILKFRGVYFER